MTHYQQLGHTGDASQMRYGWLVTTPANHIDSTRIDDI